ncbi:MULTISPECIES: sugar phosphate isomerase/epimerase [unclassified Rathayibacter]|uniref:sugar phosphate isomerase/epimerase family protein n=1 Tax=unclassified Rathayibacter TaxID=2609250 RepID=UPI0010437F44|nr:MULTISPECIES: sugar phosphate isomerase/epimerase [unclassified Rathayibacter]MCJ1702470.1 sugar phosphate isomerase/epimerase [Rathayibacter sp. VKM Ac-2926]TCL85650.1 D-psicose/D-tagatose/L-ribulose 3-epimerase [Rathayibacter sp. PhB192]TCM31471.1 D-psicose/D-tagatose/L-ribulose 3-epimerase [Rathayibacter sp. PhB179]
MRPSLVHRGSPARSSPLGVHAGLLTGDWTRESGRRAIAAAAAIGFDLIEIPAPGDPAAAAWTEALLDEHGIDAVVSLALDADSDITAADAAVSARGEERLLDAVRFAEAIGARYVGGVTYSAMRKYEHAADAAARERSLAVLRRVAAAAAPSGIALGAEYVNRYESNLLNTAAQTVAFLDELGAPNVLLHLDTFHAHVEEVDLASAVRDAGGALGYLHASENHRGELGTGSTDWTGLVAALTASGYRGPLTLESFSPRIQPTASAEAMGLWRELWHDPVALATSGHAFLAGLLDTSRSAAA